LWNTRTPAACCLWRFRAFSIAIEAAVWQAPGVKRTSRAMKWFLLFFLLPCLPVSAATFLANLNSGNTHSPPGTQLFVGEGVFTFDINDRSDLVAGLPIHVTFNPSQFFGNIGVIMGTSSGIFRDVITITAILGGETAFVSTTFVGTVGPPGFLMINPDFAPFSLTVPWESDLTALVLSMGHDGSIDGDGNRIWSGGGISTVTITTQSVPEPSVGFVVVYAGLLFRRKRAGT
jgi:hypothetical protein